MYGITAGMIRRLCDSPWDGGAGYTPAQVGAMTPDQVYFRLCDRGMLADGQRTRKVTTDHLAGQSIRAKTPDGRTIQARVGGESKAARIAREARERREAEQEKLRGKRRGSRNS